jgi:hypothetical protein
MDATLEDLLNTRRIQGIAATDDHREGLAVCREKAAALQWGVGRFSRE